MVKTYADIFDAMEKNGYPKAKRVYHDEVNDSYCAIGQAAKNLDTNPSNISDALQGIREEDVNAFMFVTHLNDGTNTTIPVIARKARSKFKAHLNIRVKF